MPGEDIMRNTTLIICSECGEGRYSAALGGGTCETCGHPVLWADIIPSLDPGEEPSTIHDPLAANGAWLAYSVMA